MISSLSDIPLFAGLSPAECAEFEQRMKRRDFAPQSTIVREGGAGDAAFVIRQRPRRRPAQGSRTRASSSCSPSSARDRCSARWRCSRGSRAPPRSSRSSRRPARCSSARTSSACMREHPGVALGVARVPRRASRRGEPACRHRLRQPGARPDRPARPHAAAAVARQRSTSCVPIAFCNNRLTLAMTNPNNIVAFDDVRRILKGVMIEPVVVTEDDFRRFMATTYAQLMAKQEPRRRGRRQAGAPAPGGPAAGGQARDRGRDGRSAAVGSDPRAAARRRHRRERRRNQAGPDERVGRRADHPAGQLDARPRHQAGRQRHPHRADGSATSPSASASTACCRWCSGCRSGCSWASSRG